MSEFLTRLDIGILFSLNSIAGRTAPLDGVIVFVAHYLPYVLPLILLVLVVRAGISSQEKITIVIATILSVVIARGLLTELIRAVYHRPRPFLTHDIVQLLPETSYSFPSGHATFFFAFAGALYFYNKRWGIWFGIAALLIGIARVMSGVHYPSDIIAGALIGILTAWAVVLCIRTFFTKTLTD